MGLNIELKGDTHHLIGAIDEFADLQQLVTTTDPVLKINLRGIKSINSLGLRKFIELMRELGNRAVEFVECSAVFVEAVNTVPLAVGGQKRIGRIKSVLAPMNCEGQHRQGVVMQIASVGIEDGMVTLPATTCPVCRTPQFLEGGLEPDDYLFFLVA